ncbi:LtfC-like domain-containing protein [Rhodococcus marinonascens]|uniref:LtfC-like domain-containing protein n=1 Tax=Rhodococcus marinonascens TaxID=38311 RepID=UPI000932D61C|nr:hypothetical protein [Rhodococcus marinonascens]
MSLGWQPKIDDIFLSYGQDWIFERTNKSGTLNAGTEIWVEWPNGTHWDGVIIGDTVSWKVEAQDADLIPSGTKYTIRVRYPDGGGVDHTNFNWYEGLARRRGV